MQNSPVVDPCLIPKKKETGVGGNGRDGQKYIDESYANHRNFFWSVGDG
jgi:hypothetical protein